MGEANLATGDWPRAIIQLVKSSQFHRRRLAGERRDIPRSIWRKCLHEPAYRSQHSLHATAATAGTRPHAGQCPPESSPCLRAACCNRTLIRSLMSPFSPRRRRAHCIDWMRRAKIVDEYTQRQDSWRFRQTRAGAGPEGHCWPFVGVTVTNGKI